jgi:hypothetical protein
MQRLTPVFPLAGGSRQHTLVSIAKVLKMAKKGFPSIDLACVAPDLFGHSLYKDQKFFVTM